MVKTLSTNSKNQWLPCYSTNNKIKEKLLLADINSKISVRWIQFKSILNVYDCETLLCSKMKATLFYVKYSLNWYTSCKSAIYMLYGLYNYVNCIFFSVTQVSSYLTSFEFYCSFYDVFQPGYASFTILILQQIHRRKQCIRKYILYIYAYI